MAVYIGLEVNKAKKRGLFFSSKYASVKTWAPLAIFNFLRKNINEFLLLFIHMFISGAEIPPKQPH